MLLGRNRYMLEIEQTVQLNVSIPKGIFRKRFLGGSELNIPVCSLIYSHTLQAFE